MKFARNEVKSERLDRILRMPDVVKAVGVSRSSIYVWTQNGAFPPCLRIGVRAIGWRESEIQKYIADRSALWPSVKQ